jgi:7-cyano-7-deazaguanine synthase
LRKKAVVLLSGGIDSSTALALAKAEGYELYALTFDYHQRHRRELESAKIVAESLAVNRFLIIQFDLREIGGSALTSELNVPKLKKHAAWSKEQKNKNHNAPCPTHHAFSQIPITYVPARNTIFLSFAVGWAEVLGAGDIFIGANAVDYSGYPDCRPEYLKAFEKMANLATKASVEGTLTFSIRAPLLFMTKAEIIQKGTALGLDYALTWSCYDPQPSQGQRGTVKGRRRTPSPLVPCRRCDSCLFRQKGFREAGIPDPLLFHEEEKQ